jgi:hypothetical protein
VTESISTVPVTAADLLVGDVFKSPGGGRYYAVDTPPVSSRYPEEYAEPKIAIWVTELNEYMIPAATYCTKLIYSSDAVLDALIPRPNNEIHTDQAQALAPRPCGSVIVWSDGK